MHSKVTSELLHLNLGLIANDVCLLLHAMVVKVPVTSIQYFVDIHSEFAFNEVRKSGIPYSDDIISYVYEIQFIQQKIAISLLDFLKTVGEIGKKGGDTMLTKSELSGIILFEAVLMYLKASVEKIIVLIGLIFGIPGLESKKNHKAKINALETHIPDRVKKLFYYEFIFNYINSDSLSDLNSYRNGILHKRGISDLQPHNYVGQQADFIPLKNLFQVLMDQHVTNSAVLIGVYAFLTDELVRLLPTSLEYKDLPLPKI
jgi:hypothetical protein